MTAAVSLRRTTWQHPEAAAALVAAVAWVVLLIPVVGPDGLRALHEEAHAAEPVAAAAFGWVTMAVAMMVPPALPAARHLALDALWTRRRRTVGLFLGGHLSLWAAFGAIALPAVALVDGLLAPGRAALLVAVLVVAAAWELAPAKWRFLRACHVLAPVPPSGRRADRACVAGGLRHGRHCVGACWPLMLAMAVSGHAALGLMALLTFVTVAERAALRPSGLARRVSAILAFAAAATLVG